MNTTLHQHWVFCLALTLLPFYQVAQAVEPITVTPDFLNEIVRSQTHAFDSLGSYKLVYEQHTKTYDAKGDFDEIVTLRREEGSGDAVFNEVDRRAETDRNVIIRGQAMVEKNTFVSRIVSSPAEFSFWTVGTATANVYKLSASDPQPSEAKHLILVHRLREFATTTSSCERYAFSSLVSHLGDPNWSVAAQDSEHSIEVTFERIDDRYVTQFTLSKAHGFLVTAAKMSLGENSFFERQIAFGEVAEKLVLPVSWTETWYDAYLPIGDFPQEPNIPSRVRTSRLVSFEQLDHHIDIDWRKLEASSSVNYIVHEGDRNPMVMTSVDGTLIPSDMIRIEGGERK